MMFKIGERVWVVPHYNPRCIYTNTISSIRRTIYEPNELYNNRREFVEYMIASKWYYEDSLYRTSEEALKVFRSRLQETIIDLQEILTGEETKDV